MFDHYKEIKNLESLFLTKENTVRKQSPKRYYFTTEQFIHVDGCLRGSEHCIHVDICLPGSWGQCIHVDVCLPGSGGLLISMVCMAFTSFPVNAWTYRIIYNTRSVRFTINSKHCYLWPQTVNLQFCL